MNEMSVPNINPNGIGAELPRFEDDRLVRGKGRYTDDVNLDGQLSMVMVRSHIAHGNIKSIDTDEAALMPGVVAVLTGKDLEDYASLPTCKVPLEQIDGSKLEAAPWRPLPTDKVRFVGEPVACVVAESLAEARDAAEAIDLDIESLDPVLDIKAADEGPAIHEGFANTVLNWRYGDKEATQKAFDEAHHVTGLSLNNQRLAIVPMEPRAAVAEFDARTERFTFRAGCQGVFGLRGQLAAIMGIDTAAIRVISDDVGGSFGMKIPAFPEYIAALHACRAFGRPVKWCDDRSESFLADLQGRDMLFDAELALDRDGNFLAVRVKSWGDLGAYVSFFGPAMPTMNIQKNTPGPYKFPLLLVETICAVTNKTPIGPYRGAGRPEGVYIMERLIDQAARELGIDRVSIRKRNFIESFPHKTSAGHSIDSGEFDHVLEAGLKKAGWAGFEQRRARSEAAGKLRGIGFCTYLEVTAGGGSELGSIRFKEDGRVDLITGTFNFGQGHHVTFAQILHDQLGIPVTDIDLVQGDSDRLIAGGGTGGSRSVMATGGALVEVAKKIVEKGRDAASMVLEAAREDIRFENGTFSVAGTDRRISIQDLARKAREIEDCPGLDHEEIVDVAPSAYPNGCHVAEVEIDPDTGRTTLLAYHAVDDFGRIVNPMLTRGQMHGGIVQGIGQVMFEQMIFDAQGQPVTGSFMDYTMPRADDLPFIEDEFIEVPAKTNALGVKGCGEAGPTGGMAATMNAICDALSDYDTTKLDMPVTAERIWRFLNRA